MMTGEQFTELFLHDIELRQYIVDMVKAYTDDIGRRVHLLCFAWMKLGDAKHGLTDEYYRRFVYCALRREWQKKYLFDYKGYPSKHPTIQHVNYYMKKRFKK